MDKSFVLLAAMRANQFLLLATAFAHICDLVGLF